MIDKQVFGHQMAVLGDRIGRQLHNATLREYYTHLSAALTTEQFVAATTLVFHAMSAAYRNWPSPAEIIELVSPVARPALAASEMFERVLETMTDPRIAPHDQRQRIQLLGAAAVRAFHASGGARDFRNVLEVDVPWLRKRFVEAYESACEHATAERVAALALNDAEARVAALISAVATAKAMPPEKQLKQLRPPDPERP